MISSSFAILRAFSSDLEPMRMSCFSSHRIARPLPMFPVPPSMPIFVNGVSVSRLCITRAKIFAYCCFMFGCSGFVFWRPFSIAWMISLSVAPARKHLSTLFCSIGA